MAKNGRFLKKRKAEMLVYGYHSVVASLENPKRRVKNLIISDNLPESQIKDFYNKCDKIKILPKKEFEKIYGKFDNNQGVILETLNLEKVDLKSELQKTKKGNSSIIIMLDHIQDPQNIGSIIRSASLFDCKNIIVAKKNSPNLNSTILKSASGGAEVVNFISVVNLVRTIKEIKRHGFWVVGLDEKSDYKIDEFEMPKKCLLVIGSEHSGLRDLTKKSCDYLVSIKFRKNNKLKIDSLNVANATSIALYEYFKKIN
ncbi:MAG: 23S rRNA (guanosine(2251)-2'-O)-methyltransferase RlmB [Pelagibacteraceae bacterium]|nr:23S rRNA (guanosine(2251)-2'-O)-methyltransferase RlmB [Pelagibacteraceae bacterium]|tara:strand:+ start:1701 stop:2471 length:771 start_codon:yes stop_codon:yes gene_type:complete